MIRVVRIGSQVQEGDDALALYDTVADRFVEIGDDQLWTRREDLELALEGAGLSVRVLPLLPQDWPSASLGAREPVRGHAEHGA